MLIDIGGEYKDIDRQEQFLDVIRTKVSHEFTEHIKDMMDEASYRAENEDVDFLYCEIEQKDNQLDEIRSMTQQLIEALEKGQRCTKQAVLPVLRRIDRKAER